MPDHKSPAKRTRPQSKPVAEAASAANLAHDKPATAPILNADQVMQLTNTLLVAASNMMNRTFAPSDAEQLEKKQELEKALRAVRDHQGNVPSPAGEESTQPVYVALAMMLDRMHQVTVRVLATAEIVCGGPGSNAQSSVPIPVDGGDGLLKDSLATISNYMTAIDYASQRINEYLT